MYSVSACFVYMYVPLTIGEKDCSIAKPITLPSTHREIKDKVLEATKSVNEVTAGSKLVCLHVSMLFLIC